MVGLWGFFRALEELIKSTGVEGRFSARFYGVSVHFRDEFKTYSYYTERSLATLVDSRNSY